MKKLFIIASLFILTAMPVMAEEEVSGCTNISAFNYNEEATVDDGSCTVLGGILPPPGLSSSIAVSGGIGGITLSFLTHQFMSCGLLVSEQTQGFAVSVYGYATTDGNTILGAVNGIYGYDRLVSMEDGAFTYHQVGVALEPGQYFVRPYCLHSGSPVLGQEQQVNIQ